MFLPCTYMASSLSQHLREHGHVSRHFFCSFHEYSPYPNLHGPLNGVLLNRVQAIIAKWERMLADRAAVESEACILHSKAMMVMERQALYTVRNKLDKAYTLGLNELLPVAERLESFKLRRPDATVSVATVLDKLAKLSITKVRVALGKVRRVANLVLFEWIGYLLLVFRHPQS